MTENRNYKKLHSLLLIFSFLSSSILMLISATLIIPTVRAESLWTQESHRDFEMGTLTNVKIMSINGNKELKLDTYELNDWTKIISTIKPNSRRAHAMASVYGENIVVLFGGGNSSNVFDDTWLYYINEKQWIKKSPLITPSGRTGSQLVSIIGTDRVLLFGGFDGTFNDETWIYDLSENNWINKTLTKKPNARTGHAIAPIYGTNKIIMYGGRGSGGTKFSDTWIYDLINETWNQRFPSNVPGDQNSYAMAPVYGTDKVILFGGGFSSETWVYDLSDNSWEEQIISLGDRPPGRTNHPMASIFGMDKVLIFGGWDSTFNYNDETWEYDLGDNKWIQKILSIKPNGRSGFNMATMFGNNKIVLFGGQNDDGYLDDTWIYRPFSYINNGEFISIPYNTGTNISLKKIYWNCSLPNKTRIKFQFRTASNEDNLYIKDFVGPNGNKLSYYDTSSADIWSGHNGNKWIQYKVYLSSTDKDKSPGLKNVTIKYNCLPKSPILKSPVNRKKVTNNKPIFSWSFTDEDSVQQSAFQVLVANDSTFENKIFDSGEQNSMKQFWQFPEGTNHTALPIGIWYWKIRTKDSDGDWGPYSDIWEFDIDTSPPNSVIYTPKNNGFYNKLNSISGIASGYNDSITKVEIIIKRNYDEQYWDGTDWSSEISWLLTNGAAEWSYDSSSIIWTSGKQYSIQSRATDDATNIESPNNGNVFIIDLDRPTSIIDNPKNNIWINKLDNISGKFIDTGNSGIDKIELSIRQTVDNKYWSGSTWSSNEVWLSAQELKTSVYNISDVQWVYNISDVQWVNNNQYIIRSRATDKAGNIESPEIGNFFKFDNQPPKDLEISINNDEEYALSNEVILSLCAEDLSSGIALMTLSTDGNNWLNWESYNTTKTFQFSDDDGYKIIYLKVKDHAGNIAEPVSDSIIIDFSLPHSLSISINNGAPQSQSKSVTLKLNAKDSISGVHQMSFSTDNIIWSDWENYTETKTYTLPPSDGEKIIFFRVKDHAGNIALPVQDQITLKTEEINDENYNNIILGLISILIIIIIIGFIVFKFKKKRSQQKKKLVGTLSVIKPPSTQQYVNTTSKINPLPITNQQIKPQIYQQSPNIPQTQPTYNTPMIPKFDITERATESPQKQYLIPSQSDTSSTNGTYFSQRQPSPILPKTTNQEKISNQEK